ncbi:MAG: hypothetical protein GX552_15770 [Chloroflexi bacterium]|jgi:hypothetical protein|nr:hypothetical protein [Chloroflexota bacterium]
MHPDIPTILEDCLARVQAGASIASCLARYPEHAEELRPLLELATAVHALPRPAARMVAVAAGEQRMLAAVPGHAQGVTLPRLFRYAGQLIARITGKENPDMKFALRLTMIALAVVLILGGGTVTAVSANALPGDTLYSIKRGAENLRLLLTTAPEAREQFESRLEAIRRDEVRAVIEEGRTVSVRFWGELTGLDNESWTVGGLRVLVQAETTIAGYPTAGAVVEVHALTQADGTMLAQALIVRDKEPTEPTIAPSPTLLPTVAPSPTPTLVPTSTPTLMPSPTPTELPEATPTATRDEDDCDDCDDDDERDHDWEDWDDWDDLEDWVSWGDWDDLDWKDWKEVWKDRKEAFKEWEKAWKEAWKSREDARKERKDQDRDQGKPQDIKKGDDEGNGKAKGHDKHENEGRGKGHDKYDGD